jgi:hypothetical protein
MQETSYSIEELLRRIMIIFSLSFNVKTCVRVETLRLLES